MHPLTFALLLQATATEVGSTACAGCHRAIYDSYMRTGMARSSGRAGAGEFRENMDAASFSAWGVAAQMARTQGAGLEFSLERGGARYTRPLEWFVGSGHVGRNYLYMVDGYLFQAPASYYTAAASFGPSPGYQSKQTVEMTRPVEPACLQCHASRVRAIAGTQNRYEQTPFAEGGVACERCHGAGSAHIAAMSKDPKATARVIVNPAKLDTARRDSVCAQCHLTGAVRVARNKAPRYRPGALLSDSVAVFVWDGPPGATSATSHYERLAQSVCRQRAGAKLWCGTCHSVHEGKTNANASCRSCHATVRHPAEMRTGDDCSGCHMPKAGTAMGDHVAYTDHFIPRNPGVSVSPAPRTDLIPFGGVTFPPRDTALAYAVAAYTEPGVRRRALAMLESAAASDARDVAVLAQLAQFYDRMGREDRAFELSQQVVRLDPAQAAAAVNLGGYLMKRERAPEAIALWRGALERNTGLIAARLNLAVALYRSGDKAAGAAELRRLLELEPDHAQARELLLVP